MEPDEYAAKWGTEVSTVTIERISKVLDGDGLPHGSKRVHRRHPASTTCPSRFTVNPPTPPGVQVERGSRPGRGPHGGLPAGDREPLERRAPPAHRLPRRGWRELGPGGRLPILRGRRPVRSPDSRDGAPRPDYRPAGRRGAALILRGVRGLGAVSGHPLFEHPHNSAPFFLVGGTGHSR